MKASSIEHEQATTTKDVIFLGVSLALLVGLGVHGNNVMLNADFFQKDYEFWEKEGIGYDDHGGLSISLPTNIIFPSTSFL